MHMLHHGGRAFDGHGWWWGFFGGILPMALFVVLIVVAVWAVLRLTRTPVSALAASVAPPGRQDLALDEVRIRYARGEMSREEFAQRSRDLGAAGPELDEPTSPQNG
jgi:putative membrane protein